MKKYLLAIVTGAVLVAGIVLSFAAGPSSTAPTNNANVVVQLEKHVQTAAWDTVVGTSDSAFILKGFTPEPAMEYILANPAWTTAAVSTGTKIIFSVVPWNSDRTVQIGNTYNFDTITITGVAATTLTIPSQQMVIPFNLARVGSKFDVYMKISADSIYCKAIDLYRRYLVTRNDFK